MTAAALVVVLALAATACSKDADKSADAKSSTTAAAGAGAEFVTDGSVPRDFPSAIPLPDGKVTASRDGVQTGGRTGWTVVKRVDRPVRPAFRAAQSALEAKGYEPRGKTTRVRDQVAQRTYANADYQVSLTVSQASRTASLVSTQVVGAQSG